MKTKAILAILMAALIMPCVASAQLGKIFKQAPNNKPGETRQTSATNEWVAKGTAGGVDYVMTGKINHDDYDKTQTSTVSFSRIPETLEEFLELQKDLGVEPQGALALQVIAFEMYRRDKTVGAEAMRANNTPTNFNDCMRQLPQKLGKDPSYAQPYIVAALMLGASPANGYQPRKPYTISVRVNPAVEYKESQLLGGTVLFLQINSQGWSQNWRGAEVVKPYDSDYYLVSNCPAFYVGCAPMRGQWTPIE